MLADSRLPFLHQTQRKIIFTHYLLSLCTKNLKWRQRATTKPCLSCCGSSSSRAETVCFQGSSGGKSLNFLKCSGKFWVYSKTIWSFCCSPLAFFLMESSFVMLLCLSLLRSGMMSRHCRQRGLQPWRASRKGTQQAMRTPKPFTNIIVSSVSRGPTSQYAICWPSRRGANFGMLRT